MKFPQNLSASMEGRPYPCCYDFKWSEITARGDWSSEPLLFWFQMKWKDSKGILVASVSMPTSCGGNIGPSLLQNAIKMYFINNILWRRGGPMFPPQGVVIETEVTNIRSSLAVFSLHLKSKQQGLWTPVSPCCYFTSFEIITLGPWSPFHWGR